MHGNYFHASSNYTTRTYIHIINKLKHPNKLNMNNKLKSLILLLAIVLFSTSCLPKRKIVGEVLMELHAAEKWNDIIELSHNNFLETEEELFVLANAYFESNKSDSAIYVCNQILEKDSTYHYATLTIADSFFKQENYIKAEEYYIKTIKLSPDYATAYINLGNLYEVAKMKEDAINTYMHAVELFLSNQYLDEVVRVSNYIISIDSKNTYAYKFLAEAYRQQNDYDSAIDALKKVLDISYETDNGIELFETNALLGNLLYAKGDYELASKMLEQSVENIEYIADYKWLIYCDLSASYNKLGYMDKSLKYSNLAKEIDEEKTISYINKLLQY